MRALFSFIGMLSLASTITFAANAGCKQDMERELRDPVAALEACYGVGTACYGKVSLSGGARLGVKTCKNVMSDACFTKLSTFTTNAAGAAACRNVGIACFKKANVFESAEVAARKCKGQ